MYSKIVKRAFDLIISLLLILLFIIPITIICLFIKLTSKGPAIFAQARTGKDGKIFKLYKLRTMTVDSPKQVTGIGRFLRKTSIDELPQLINIFKGDMSFIGPRPWVPEYYMQFNENQKRRVSVLPGLSGYAQVNGRNDISIFDKINYDIYYVENISLKLDLYIFFKTIKTVITSRSYDDSFTTVEEEIAQLAAQHSDTVKSSVGIIQEQPPAQKNDQPVLTVDRQTVFQ